MSPPGYDEADRLVDVPHPRQATRLIGHSDQEEALLEAYRSGRLPHAIVLGGPRGIGKATLAWRLAKFLLANPRSDSAEVRVAKDLFVPAGSKVASQVVSLSHPDLVLLRREINDKSKRFYAEIRADDVRRAIAIFQRAAGAGGFRICIVDSAEDLNRSSANALLKIIEEPPPASLFLIVAHRPGLVLPTIRSRASLVRLDPLSPEAIIQVIGGLGPPWSEFDIRTTAAAASQAHGSTHDALRLLQSRDGELAATVKEVLDRLPLVDWRKVHAIADKAGARDGDETYETTLSLVLDWLAMAVRQGAGGPPSRLARYAEVWERVAQSVRETDALNLDKRPLILSIFSDLATAVRTAA